MDIRIGIPQNRKTELPKISVSYGVFGLTCLLKVLRTIHFDDDLCRSDIKINDIWSVGFLSMRLYASLLQKVIPKMPFFLCHFPTETLGVCGVFLIAELWHVVCS